MTPERKAELRELAKRVFWKISPLRMAIFNGFNEALDALDAAEAEIARLHEVIERAPHERGCYGRLGNPPFPGRCNCWKRGVLDVIPAAMRRL